MGLGDHRRLDYWNIVHARNCQIGSNLRPNIVVTRSNGMPRSEPVDFDVFNEGRARRLKRQQH